MSLFVIDRSAPDLLSLSAMSPGAKEQKSNRDCLVRLWEFLLPLLQV